MECICGFKKQCPDIKLGDSLKLSSYVGTCHKCGGPNNWLDIPVTYLGDVENKDVSWHMHRIDREQYCENCNRMMKRLSINCRWQGFKAPALFTKVQEETPNGRKQ